jgi:deazaflavin-dependent oxidoreductase (nitroreductase family)
MPSWLPAVNRAVVNPLQRHWAPYLPPLALIVHRGRRSGKEHTSPVLAFRSDGTLAVPLPYGSNTHWVRNLMAAGEGEVRRAGKRHRIASPRIVDDPQPAERLHPAMRAAARKMPIFVADLV